MKQRQKTLIFLNVTTATPWASSTSRSNSREPEQHFIDSKQTISLRGHFTKFKPHKYTRNHKNINPYFPLTVGRAEITAGIHQGTPNAHVWGAESRQRKSSRDLLEASRRGAPSLHGQGRGCGMMKIPLSCSPAVYSRFSTLFAHQYCFRVKRLCLNLNVLEV